MQKQGITERNAPLWRKCEPRTSADDRWRPGTCLNDLWEHFAPQSICLSTGIAVCIPGSQVLTLHMNNYQSLTCLRPDNCLGKTQAMCQVIGSSVAQLLDLGTSCINVVPKIPHAECEFSKGLFSVFRSVLAHNLERSSIFSQPDFNQDTSERSVQIFTVNQILKLGRVLVRVNVTSKQPAFQSFDQHVLEG